MAAFNRPYGTLWEGGDLVPRNQFLGYFQPSLRDGKMAVCKNKQLKTVQPAPLSMLECNGSLQTHPKRCQLSPQPFELAGHSINGVTDNECELEAVCHIPNCNFALAFPPGFD